jgi:NADPH:quinone reductase-like Zn-dependent oxidoreductase
MKAVKLEKYGSPEVLELREVPKPAPGDDEVLIEVHAAALNAADWHVMRGEPKFARVMLGLTKPKRQILGADVAGIVEAVGKNVTRFKPGDAVYGALDGNAGTCAEYTTAMESVLDLVPARLTFEEAAAVPLAATSALQALRTRGGLKPGMKVAINGASGGVGIFAIQIAKALGGEVTAICSTRNLEQARTLGADHVIDYKFEDFTHSGLRYDLIVAANGYHPLSDYQRALAPGGVYVMVGGQPKQMIDSLLMGPFMSMRSGVKMGALSAQASGDDLRFLSALIEAGKLKPVIDRVYPLEQVPDAMRYLEEGHARGKVVVKVK